MRNLIEQKRIEQIAEALGVEADRLGMPRPTLLELAEERFTTHLDRVADRHRLRNAIDPGHLAGLHCRTCPALTL